MAKRKVTLLAEASYRPDERILSLIHELLQFDLYKKELEAKVSAGGKLTGAEINERKRRRANLSKRKTDILNGIIFPSMANLTVFLELTFARDLYKDFEFDEELKQLFLGASKLPNRDTATVFERFIIAALQPTLNKEERKDDDMPSLTDFRFILLEMIQRQICNMIVGVIPQKFNTPDLLNNVVSHDLGRGIAWTSMLATEAQTAIHFNRDNRPVLF